MPAVPRLIPLWIKIAYTAFMAVLIPVYLKNYGPTNFLYFCGVAAHITLVAIWLESSLLLSAALIGAFVPQMLWVVDFFVEVANWAGVAGPDHEVHLTSLTSYMFQPPYFLRFLSFYHFWLVFLLMYLVWRVGFDRRGLIVWCAVAWVLLTVSYVYLPPPSPSKDPVTQEPLRDPNIPVNIDYVYNIAGDEGPQKWMDADLYFALYMVILVVGIYLPTHLLFCWLVPAPKEEAGATSSQST